MTTRAEPEIAALEVPDRDGEAVARLVRTARAAGRARRALNGEKVGRELDMRLAASIAATQELHKAIDELLDAEINEGIQD